MRREKLFSRKERKVLEKYKEPREVDEEDEKILDKFRVVGFIGFPGFNTDTMKEIACLTPLGIAHLNR